jgi:hypothetical protein
MIKFTATNPNSGSKLIGLGITAANVELLKQGKPIHVKFSELGLPWDGEILLFFGETEDAIAKDLAAQGLIPPITVGEGKIAHDLHNKWPGKRRK